MKDDGWSRKFDEPISLRNGRKLVTLRDAGEYIAALPAGEQKKPEWETAAQALMLVVKSKCQTMMARVGIMRALHGASEEQPGETRRKPAKKYRVVR